MAFWRPFRRPNRNLGTMDGNPSMLDEVNAEGPPVLPVGGVLADIGYWDREREAAVEGDLEMDIDSDFDAVGKAEDSERDALAED